MMIRLLDETLSASTHCASEGEIENTGMMIIDGTQYCNWSRAIFEEMRAGGVSAVHVTIAYHEDFRQTVQVISDWNRRFIDHADLIAHATTAEMIAAAHASGRTAIIFGMQTAGPIESDLGMVEIMHTLGVRFMQLSYNNQSLLCAGWQEPVDSGVTRFGREVIAEMNRLGMVIDLSHSGERSTLEAIDLSARPVTVSHANPSWWRETKRNKSDAVIKALAHRGGMLGFSLYPHHLQGGSDCALQDFTSMIRDVGDRIGAANIGIGSDLCQGQPDAIVQWMRIGRWTVPSADSTDAKATFPAQPQWFQSNRDFANISDGLAGAGFNKSEIEGIMGRNWFRFMQDAFSPQTTVAKG
jgi:membrane dipeptidase